MTPDTTTTREYQVRYPDGGSTAPPLTEHEARRLVQAYGGKVYARTVTTTVSTSAWAEVVEAKEAQHG